MTLVEFVTCISEAMLLNCPVLFFRLFYLISRSIALSFSLITAFK